MEGQVLEETFSLKRCADVASVTFKMLIMPSKTRSSSGLKGVGALAPFKWSSVCGGEDKEEGGRGKSKREEQG